MRRFLWFAAYLLLTCVCGGRPAEAAKLYGLVIGIDAYGGGNALKGAVNDASDIGTALAGAGASKVVRLIGEQATRRAVVSAWSALAAKAIRGDTVVFSFAGEGGVAGGARALLLAGYAESGPGSEQRIALGELMHWFQALDADGVTAILVADASFGGGLPRPFPRALVRLRQWTVAAKATPSQPGGLNADDFSYCLFAYASGPGEAAPEIEIGGKPRGALSFAFARAIEGRADQDGDGQVTDSELVAYLPRAVAALSEGQQSPVVLPHRSSTHALFDVPLGVADRIAPPPASAGLRLAVTGVTGGGEGPYRGATLVNDAKSADLIWSVETGDVESRIGGLAATGVDEGRVGPILAAWSALGWLTYEAALNPAPASLVSGNGLYHKGDLVQIEILPACYPHLILFDLMPDGRLVFLSPGSPQEAAMDWSRQHLHQMFQADAPPYGAMHRVAILSGAALPGLVAALKTMDKAGNAAGLQGALTRALPPGAKAQLAIFPIYFGPGG
jgi:Caspase domain